MICFAVITRLTPDNEARRRALAIAKLTHKDLAEDDLALQTSEECWAVELSLEMQTPYTQLFAGMSSRDYTRYRARSFVTAAIADIQDDRRNGKSPDIVGGKAWLPAV
jgi:hypothetical protein